MSFVEGDKVAVIENFRLAYSNGDVFYGEFYNGRRHGYGVYCWTNGDIWYGRYKDGYRNGYGMLIKSGNMIYYGKWVGDSKVVE